MESTRIEDLEDGPDMASKILEELDAVQETESVSDIESPMVKKDKVMVALNHYKSPIFVAVIVGILTNKNVNELIAKIPYISNIGSGIPYTILLGLVGAIIFILLERFVKI